MSAPRDVFGGAPGDQVSSLTVRLPRQLHVAFVAACRSADETSSQVLRRAMREYVERSRGADLEDRA